MVEKKCGNCLYWYPWKSFAIRGKLSERRIVQKGLETGCDGKCGFYIILEREEYTPEELENFERGLRQ